MIIICTRLKKNKKKNKKNKKKNKKNKKNKKKQDKKPFGPDEVIEWIINREKAHINNELFKKHFKVQKPIVMYKVLYKTNNKEKNSKLVNIFNSGLKDLEEQIKEMSEQEREIEKPYNIAKVVKKNLEINKLNQEGKGLKILTPVQMLSRLSITLAQLKAGNNPGKLKNEIRQLLYSLYRSKNMTKQVYNNLINY